VLDADCLGLLSMLLVVLLPQIQLFLSNNDEMTKLRDRQALVDLHGFSLEHETSIAGVFGVSRSIHWPCSKADYVIDSYNTVMTHLLHGFSKPIISTVTKGDLNSVMPSKQFS
jgi:hypothetical protein